MIINVTQEDIDKGVTGDCALCPLAKAIHRYFPNIPYGLKVNDGVRVHFDRISIDFKLYKVTKNCQRFIDNFDNGNLVHPFKFNLMEQKNV